MNLSEQLNFNLIKISDLKINNYNLTHFQRSSNSPKWLIESLKKISVVLVFLTWSLKMFCEKVKGETKCG